MVDPVAQADTAYANAREQMALELAKASAKLPPEAREVFYRVTRDAAAHWLEARGHV